MTALPTDVVVVVVVVLFFFCTPHPFRNSCLASYSNRSKVSYHPLARRELRRALRDSRSARRDLRRARRPKNCKYRGLKFSFNFDCLLLVVSSSYMTNLTILFSGRLTRHEERNIYRNTAILTVFVSF